MSTIIAGHFAQQEQVQAAVDALHKEGFYGDSVAAFYLNPPGQHGLYPIGGDVAMSRGAKETDKGAVMGAATGAVAGAAAAPVLGPVGPVTGGLLGAYLGSLVGGLTEMKERGDKGKEGDVENTLPMRKSGMMVAVALPEEAQANGVVDLLRSLGATDVERADGKIEDGNWVDFDPLDPPSMVDGKNAAPRS